MFTRQCSAPGCPGIAKARSPFCSGHRKAKTRHGDITQSSITVYRLAPYLKRIEGRHKANLEKAAWDILSRRWAALVADSLRTIEHYEAGFASVRHHVEAAQQVRTLDGLGDPFRVIHVILAMYLMAEAEPRAFASDTGFAYQLVRRVVRLAPVNRGTYWCHREKRMRGVYRDMPPRTVEALAADLTDTFGAAGVQLARIEQQPRVNRAEEARKALEAAIGDLE